MRDTSQSSVKLGFKNASWEGGLKYVREGADFCCLNKDKKNSLLFSFDLP